MTESLQPGISKFEDEGYAVVNSGLSSGALSELSGLLDTSHAGERNLLDVPIVRQLARSNAVRNLVIPVLGASCFAVRGVLFNKVDGANWKVVWHQDSVIGVAERKEIPGWGPWSIKARIHHVRPSSDLMSGMLAIRIYLDDCGGDNGPLRVIPGSHKRGFLSDSQIREWPKAGAVTCVASRDEAILMRPLLLHSSPTAKAPSGRRVVHLEFAVEQLPTGINWRDECKGGATRCQLRRTLSETASPASAKST